MNASSATNLDAKPASASAPTQRKACPRCLRPETACICQWIRSTAHDVEVLILQHPLEVNEAKGSGRLLHLSLPNSRLVAGDVFDLNVLFPGADAVAGHKRNLLLYPETPLAGNTGNTGNELPRETLPPAAMENIASLRLIVLDGTWRKSRKMLHLNPWLQRLSRLALEQVPDSRYRIRKAHKTGQLSTFEAACAALMQLHGDEAIDAIEARFQPLLDAFDGFVAQQQAFRSAAISRPGR